MRSLFIIMAITTTTFAEEPGRKPNRLAKESSPYLLQHAHNPVDWYPWGPEAFAKARKDGKLVFLSVGYSACHWCHVMERESFANAAVAKILNAHFICIKVDREERPDVDDLYLTALNVLGNSGGWPMSVFLTAEGKPIFGGTYWPPDDKEIDGETVPGFKSILNRVVELNRDKREQLLAQANEVAERTAAALDKAGIGVAVVPLKPELIREAIESYDIDPEHGGFGRRFAQYRGTKFPRVPALRFLLNQPVTPANAETRKLVLLTLDKMATGGIYDHLGGGFHRYSTERTWTVPHFEKMLYDNAQLVELYADAYEQTQSPEYRRVITETLDFMAREMTAPEGVFYSALDADSEGEEGRFYVWTQAELDSLLGTNEQAKRFRTAYGLESPNFEEKYSILRLSKPLDAETRKQLEPLKNKLLAARNQRERPFLDTKVLTGWNGQMIAAYARAGQVLGEPKFVAAAERAAEFLLKNLRDPQGRLLRVWAAAPGAKPSARGPAFLDDYAFLTHGLLTLHDATRSDRWLREAQAVTDQMLERFGDTKRGGFYTTPHDGETLFARGKDYYDGAQPSGNGIAARNLLRLGAKTGTKKYQEAGERAVRHFTSQLQANAGGSPVLMESVALLLDRPGTPVAEPATGAKPAGTPRRSGDVVHMQATLVGREIRLVLTVDKPWHLYANPPGGKDLAGSATRVEVLQNGKVLAAQWNYPTGTPTRDAIAGEYRIYAGETTLTGTLDSFDPQAGTLTVRVTVLACTTGKCLLPSTVTQTVK